MYPFSDIVLANAVTTVSMGGLMTANIRIENERDIDDFNLDGINCHLSDSTVSWLFDVLSQCLTIFLHEMGRIDE